ncbi:hypothetical protein ACTPOK_01075 [Streptomyces inhibens]|uniref:hypothetical protein n=1 Tax=Streptomyces inhibens TaxID=2293571 RepID=UPI00402A6A2D
MKRSLLSLRAAVVLSLGMVGGAGAGTLSLLAGHPTADSALCALAGAGAVITFLDRVIAADRDTAPERAVPGPDGSEQSRRHV